MLQALSVPSQTTEFQYAVPVTLESFVRGFSIHSFWAPQFWKSRMRAFREGNYTILDRDNSNRRIARRLPEEILIAIQQHVMVDSLDEGRQAWKNCKGTLRAEVDAEVFRNVDRLSQQGRFMKVGYIDDLEDSLIKRYMMEIFGLALMPGFSGLALAFTHVFLCIPKRLGCPIEAGSWDPRNHLHPILTKRGPSVSTVSQVVLVPLEHGWGTDWTRMEVLDPEYVAAYISDNPSHLSRAFQEMELDLVALEDPWARSTKVRAST